MARILICEDHRQLREILAEALQDEHTVITAGDGAEGFARFQDSSIDLVLTDMSMPVMTGPQLIAEIQHVSPQTPIIGMSAGLSLSQLDVERTRRGIHRCFSKPMSLHDLRHSIESALKSRDPNVQTAA